MKKKKTTSRIEYSERERNAYLAALPLLEAGLSERGTRELLIKFGYADAMGELFHVVDWGAAVQTRKPVLFDSNDLRTKPAVRRRFEAMIDHAFDEAAP